MREGYRAGRPDAESQIVARLIREAGEAGVRAGPVSIANVYVALKCRPLVILAGPGQSGKIALIRSLAQVLAEGDPMRCQMMPGHAWWAEHSGNVALLTEAQTRLNADKILGLIEAAWALGNASRIFIACLARISPAELTGFFSEVAFQLRHGQIMRLPTAHLSQPIPFPPNLFLVGTMDTDRRAWLDEDLLAMAAVIDWRAGEAGPARPVSPSEMALPGEAEFLRSRIRSERAARQKLPRLPGVRLSALRWLLEIEGRVTRYRGKPSPPAVGAALVYLANSWTRRGTGLFHRSPEANLQIALDLSITQILLAPVQAAVRESPALREELREMLRAGRFWRAESFLENPG